MFSEWDILYYAHICYVLDLGTFCFLQEEYPNPDRYRAAAEAGYCLKHGKPLPEFEFIESVIDTGNGLIFVHKLRRKRYDA